MCQRRSISGRFLVQGEMARWDWGETIVCITAIFGVHAAF